MATLRGRPARRLLYPLAVLAVLLALPSAHSAFSATTGNATNLLAADRLAPPSGLSATQTCSVPPAIAFRAATTAAATDSLTLGIPPGTVSGDLLLVQVAYAYTTAALTAPAGWTLVRRDSSSTVLTSALYRKTAAGESNATFAFPAGSGVAMVGGVAAYSGVSSTTPVDASAGVAGFGGVAITPAVTTTTANTVLVRFIANAHEAYPAPPGTTQRWQHTSATGGISAGDEPFAGPGTATERNSSSPSGTSAHGVGQTVALRRAPGTPSAVLSWTSTPSSWADGYRAERVVAGTVQASRTVPFGTTTVTDAGLVNGTTYTYRVRAYRGSWVSADVVTTLTPSC